MKMTHLAQLQRTCFPPLPSISPRLRLASLRPSGSRTRPMLASVSSPCPEILLYLPLGAPPLQGSPLPAPQTSPPHAFHQAADTQVTSAFRSTSCCRGHSVPGDNTPPRFWPTLSGEKKIFCFHFLMQIFIRLYLSSWGFFVF